MAMLQLTNVGGLCASLLLVVASLRTATGSSAVQDGGPLTYSIVEEQPSGTVVGELALDSRLDAVYEPEVFRQLSFVFLGRAQPSELFALDERTGTLRTATVIDRDSICRQMSHCVVALDVAVQPAAYFQV